ncbi:hypothetical protein EDC56_3770 [Sinobacterium caligoides]|uniref:Uncharacterized protein n=1 Tax=Sinobacterium caligoides TaxID=933926 RepID=A0A3N2D574_9GAMM|nr:hypothetical protein [Sinobacterium caligoides]ROR94955.1 hypothetical protein EDC56_3770 [Sinobacterium caligoides]
MQLFDQKYWGGVCGFVSVIHGILLSKNGGDALDGLSKDELQYNLGLSVVSFLKYAKQNKELADDMVNFTQTFGGVHANKTIDILIRECQVALSAITGKGSTDKAKATEAGWGIAMSKGALMAYIKWIGAQAVEVKHHSTDWSQENLSRYKNSVCGVGTFADKGTKYLGLRHWVYINEDGYMYNWGGQTEMAETEEAPYEDSRHDYLVHVLKLG